MATKSTASADTTVGAKKTAAPQQVESVYTAAELADNAMTLFKVRKECVAAALKAAGKDNATVSAAKKIVADFMSKEVM